MPETPPSATNRKRNEKRAEMARRLAPHLLEAGLGDIGLRRLADVAGTSDRMLLYYFENKQDLVASVLLEIAGQLTRALGEIFTGAPQPPARVLEALWDVAVSRTLTDQLKLWVDLSSRASRGDPFFGAIVEQVRGGWVAWMSTLLDLPDDEKEATALLVMGAVDGQVVLFPDDLTRGDAAIRRLIALLER